MSGFDNMLDETKGLQNVVKVFCVKLALHVPVDVKISHHRQVLFHHMFFKKLRKLLQGHSMLPGSFRYPSVKQSLQDRTDIWRNVTI